MPRLVLAIAAAVLLASCGGRSSPKPLPTTKKPSASGSSCLVAPAGVDLAPLGYGRITPKKGVPCFGLFARTSDAERTTKLLSHQLPNLGVQELDADESAALAGTMPLFLGAPVRVMDDDGMSTASVQRPGDDVVIVIQQRQFEGEPTIAMVWILDGRSGNAFVRAAWAVAATGGKAVYSKQHLVVDETSEDPPSDHRDAVAAAIGISRAELDAARFHDGFAGNGHVAQPVVIDLATGAETALPIAGGGELRAHDGRFYARLKPWYWNRQRVASDPVAPAYRLDLATGKLALVTGNDANSLAQLFAAPPPTIEQLDWSSDSPRKIGEVLVATSVRSVGLIVVNDGRSVQPARMPALPHHPQ